MFKKKNVSKKVTRRNFSDTKMAKGVGRIGREVAYVGLGVTTAVVTAGATAVAGGVAADAGQALYDKATGGATAVVKEKGLFKKTKEVKISEMKALKKYKSVKLQGLHDPATREKVAKGALYVGGGIGAVTGVTTYATLRGIESGIKLASQVNLAYHDLSDEETFGEVLDEEEA